MSRRKAGHEPLARADSPRVVRDVEKAERVQLLSLLTTVQHATMLRDYAAASVLLRYASSLAAALTELASASDLEEQGAAVRKLRALHGDSP